MDFDKHFQKDGTETSWEISVNQRLFYSKMLLQNEFEHIKY